MASEEDLRVAEFLAGRYAVGPAQRQAAAEFATALTAARAETWKEAIEIAKRHCYWGGFQNKRVVEALEACRRE